jgi:hypothetical protein
VRIRLAPCATNLAAEPRIERVDVLAEKLPG